MSLRETLVLFNIIINKIVKNKIFIYCYIGLFLLLTVYFIVHYYNKYVDFSNAFDLEHADEIALMKEIQEARNKDNEYIKIPHLIGESI